MLRNVLTPMIARSAVPAVIGVMLLVWAALCFSPGLSAPYHFDSAVWLDGNPQIALAGSDFPRIYEASVGTTAGPLRRPLAMLSFALESLVVGGLQPRASNLINLGLHLLNGVLLFLVCRRLLARLAIDAQRTPQPAHAALLALLVAGAWLLHPLQASTVFYAIQRMTILAATGVLFGLWLYLRAREVLLDTRPVAAPLVSLLTGLAGCTLLAALAKESGVLLPWFVVLLEVYVFRYRLGGLVSRPLQWCCRLMLVVPVVVACAMLWLLPESLSVLYQSRDFSPGERLLSEARILWHYLGWIAWPGSSAIGFYHDDILPSAGWMSPWTGALAVLAWAAVTTLAWALRRRAPLAGLGIAWFLVAHALESTILPLELVFEHRNYLALAGPLLFALGVAAPRAAAARPSRILLAAVPIWVMLGALLGMLASAWGDELQFAARNLRNHPQSERALYHYANVQLRRGEETTDAEARKTHIVTARAHYELLLERFPDGLVAPVTLLYIDSAWFAQLDTVEQWVQRIERGMRSDRKSRADANALGLLVDCVNSGICALPAQRVETMLGLAVDTGCCGTSYAHSQTGRYFLGAGDDAARALQAFDRALALEPRMPMAHAGRVQALVARGERAAAMRSAMDWLYADPLLASIASVLGVFR